MSKAKVRQDHDTIRHWAEARGAKPSAVADTKSLADPGILRPDFDPKDKALDVLTGGEFFEKFDEAELSLPGKDRGRKSQPVPQIHP